MDVNSILGVVESAQVDGERGVARLRFSERAAAILNDIRDGIIRSISVGYVVNQRRVEKDPATGTRTIVATAWAGKEISLVAIGADPAAKVRGATIEQTHENEIRVIAQIAGLQADDMIARNLTLDQARAEAFEALKRRAGPSIRTAQPVVTPSGYDDPLFLRAAMADAIYMRINPAHNPAKRRARSLAAAWCGRRKNFSGFAASKPSGCRMPPSWIARSTAPAIFRCCWATLPTRWSRSRWPRRPRSSNRSAARRPLTISAIATRSSWGKRPRS
jgi:hypothetical protein